ncbi:hypothetical protein OVA19_29580 [Streptomyces sp. SL203]|nr:hypothetical protein [Streptomyces sp. SL203]MCY1654627.1 hypothetical protein [Streptomyces sp. SL203]
MRPDGPARPARDPRARRPGPRGGPRRGAVPEPRVSRSILRRDFPTALRLVRWLAWLRHEGAELPLDPDVAAEHAWLVGGTGPRTALDLAIARHFLEQRPGTPPKETARP